VDADLMVEMTKQVKSATYIIIIIQVIASLFLKGGMSELLSLFFTLQLVVALKVYDTSLPANIDEFSIRIQEVIQFEFLKPVGIIRIFKPDFKTKAFYD
jgi:diacylglycerol kinase